MKTYKLTMVLAALFVSTALQSATVVIVETTRIIQETIQGKKIQEKVKDEQGKLAQPLLEIETKLKKQEAEIVNLQKDLAQKEESLKKQATVLSAEALSEKYEELRKQHQDLEDTIADFQKTRRKAQDDAKRVDQKLEQLYRKEMMTFEQEIRALIEQISKAEGWDIVLAKESLIFASQTVDKTDYIIKKLDEKENKRIALEKAANAVKKQ